MQPRRGFPRSIWDAILPTLRYWTETEVHALAFSVAANVLLGFFPFLIVSVSLSRIFFSRQTTVAAIDFALRDYFPDALGSFLSSNLPAAAGDRLDRDPAPAVFVERNFRAAGGGAQQDLGHPQESQLSAQSAGEPGADLLLRQPGAAFARHHRTARRIVGRFADRTVDLDPVFQAGRRAADLADSVSDLPLSAQRPAAASIA